MKRNLLLIFAVLFAVFLVVNSTRRIVTFKGTSEKVSEAREKLESLRNENEQLKHELEYKKSGEFKEAEIRNKLGLVREGEALVIIPKEAVDGQSSIDNSQQGKPNWQKWRELFFGDS